MFLLRFSNVPAADREAETLTAIFAEAKRCGFCCVITNSADGDIVATYSPLYGVHVQSSFWKAELAAETQRAARPIFPSSADLGTMLSQRDV